MYSYVELKDKAGQEWHETYSIPHILGLYLVYRISKNRKLLPLEILPPFPLPSALI